MILSWVSPYVITSDLSSISTPIVFFRIVLTLFSLPLTSRCLVPDRGLAVLERSLLRSPGGVHCSSLGTSSVSAKSPSSKKGHKWVRSWGASWVGLSSVLLTWYSDLTFFVYLAQTRTPNHTVGHFTLQLLSGPSKSGHGLSVSLCVLSLCTEKDGIRLVQ